VDGIVAFLSSSHVSAATVKLQGAFETAFADAHGAVDRRRRARTRKLKDIGDSIVSVSAVDSTDMTALVSLHKQIAAYVLAYLTSEPSAAGAKAVGDGAADAAQREISAAMESVFPRVGVRHFTLLASGDKTAQLDELAHLVLGIRLFNWAGGKGGVGMEDVPAAAAAAARGAIADMDRSVLTTQETCQQYVNLLLATRGRAVTVSPAAVATWTLELCYHRQLSIYASSLAAELKAHLAALEESAGRYAGEMASLRELVGSRATVSKEAVYPHFHNAAAHWFKLAEIRDAIASACEVAKAVSPFLATKMGTLPPESSLAEARRALLSGAVSVTLTTPPADVAASAAASMAAGDMGTPTLLSLDRSPQFLQLPLEYQGFCPVSLVSSVPAVAAETAAAAPAEVAAAVPPGGPALHRSSALPDLGVLMQGDVSLGVVRWDGRHYVCSNKAAVEAFMSAPGWYVTRVRALAAQHEELVQLLQLVSPDGFPEALLPMLIQYDGDLAATAAATRIAMPEVAAADPARRAEAVRLSKNGRALVDEGVQTPVHFIERAIDPLYTWNEWALRRRALAVMNLLNCRTTSQQTDASAARKHAETQVYLPKAMETQTGISTGTNTDRVVTYVAGLRGVREPVVEAAALARGFRGEGRSPLAAGGGSSTLGHVADAAAGAGEVGGAAHTIQPARDRITASTQCGAAPLEAAGSDPTRSGGVRVATVRLTSDPSDPALPKPGDLVRDYPLRATGAVSRPPGIVPTKAAPTTAAPVGAGRGTR